MARMHSRKKGKSGSSRPVKVDLSFVKFKPKEIEKVICDLKKNDGLKKSQIGLFLRDTYGIPNIKKLCGESISKILEKNKIVVKIPEDLQCLIEKRNKLIKHLKNNSRDIHNKRGLKLIESKIRRISTYYKRNGKLDVSWRMK